MFPQLPIELEYIIWQNFWSRFVLKEIKERDSIWRNPSKKILKITREIGAIQIKHSDLERLLLQHNNDIYHSAIYHWCLQNVCIRCKDEGFPCRYATFCCGLPKKIVYNWELY